MDPLVVGAISAAVVAAVLVASLAAHRANQRQRALPAVAARAGLRFSPVDRFNSLAVAFPLLRAGDGREVENVMWRDDGSSPPRAFDYAYYDEYRGRSGTTARTWHTYTCALAQHNGSWPPISVSKEGLTHRAFAKLGLPDIDFESEEFNRTFRVTCPDRRFASALIDPQMMELMLAAGGDVSFETKGRFVLLSARRLEAAAVPGLFRMAEEFLRRVPPAVRELWPSFPDGAGTDVFPLPRLPEPDRPGGLLGEEIDPLAGWNGGPTAGAFRFAPAPRLRDPDQTWDPTPGIEHDLDGEPIPPVEESPWTDRPLPHDPDVG